jgi:hypothetical protein
VQDDSGRDLLTLLTSKAHLITLKYPEVTENLILKYRKYHLRAPAINVIDEWSPDLSSRILATLLFSNKDRSMAASHVRLHVIRLHIEPSHAPSCTV